MDGNAAAHPAVHLSFSPNLSYAVLILKMGEVDPLTWREIAMQIRDDARLSDIERRFLFSELDARERYLRTLEENDPDPAERERECGD